MLVQAYQAPQNPRNLGGHSQISYTENVSDGNIRAHFEEDLNTTRNVPITVNESSDAAGTQGLQRNYEKEMTNIKRGDDSDSEFNATKESQSDINLKVESDLTQTMSEVIEWEITVNETFTPKHNESADNDYSTTGNIADAGVMKVSNRSLHENGDANKEIASSHFDVNSHENTPTGLHDSGFHENLSLHMIQEKNR